MSQTQSAGGLKLVEQCSGVGSLALGDRVFDKVAYDVKRFQGISASGMPIPGLHRFEGSVDIAGLPALRERVGASFTLRLQDGRAWRVTLADENGSILTEGHGPSRCTCC